MSPCSSSGTGGRRNVILRIFVSSILSENADFSGQSENAVSSLSLWTGSRKINDKFKTLHFMINQDTIFNSWWRWRCYRFILFHSYSADHTYILLCALKNLCRISRWNYNQKLHTQHLRRSTKENNCRSWCKSKAAEKLSTRKIAYWHCFYHLYTFLPNFGTLSHQLYSSMPPIRDNKGGSNRLLQPRNHLYPALCSGWQRGYKAFQMSISRNSMVFCLIRWERMSRRSHKNTLPAEKESKKAFSSHSNVHQNVGLPALEEWIQPGLCTAY